MSHKWRYRRQPSNHSHLMLSPILIVASLLSIGDEIRGGEEDNLHPQNNRLASPIVKLHAHDQEITLRALNQERLFLLTRGNEESRLPFPEECGPVRELVATWWKSDGFAIAVECEGADEPFEYHWITCEIWDTPKTETMVLKSFNEMILATKTDFDVASIRNSGGDSIYIILASRLDQGDSMKAKVPKSLKTVVYINDCPRGKGWGRMLEKAEIQLE